MLSRSESSPGELLVVVLCTAPNDAAEALARQLVQTRLAACVNIFAGITSVYRWQGDLQHDSESQLIIKTREACLSSLEAWLDDHHPYDTPEFLVLPVAAVGEKYGKWLLEETRHD